MRKTSIFLCFTLLLSLIVSSSVSATEKSDLYPLSFPVFEEWTSAEAGATLNDSFPCKASLLMEASTGKVLYAAKETEPLPIASVTKIMTTLLVVEAIDSGKITLNDQVTVSSYAASMGGSQVFLEPGEQMSVHELLKCLIVVSANDAAVALAEHIYGSSESFVAAMNERAAQLGMNNTNFVNTTGLDDIGYASALDVALMTQELLKHALIFDYTTIWMDTIRNGEFGLSNTNRLVRFYNGANGMKTGFTDKAMYCVSATAKRDGMQLIAVVLGAPTSDERFATAKKMLDFGFANYCTVMPDIPKLENVRINGGTEYSLPLEISVNELLIEKGKSDLSYKIELPEVIDSALKKGQPVGRLIISQGNEELCTLPINAACDVEMMDFGKMLKLIWKKILSFV